MVHWDDDGKKDLLAGLSDGSVRIYLNVNTDASPEFDGGTSIEVGAPGSKLPIDVGSRATPVVVDWNGDGRKDLLIGAIDGRAYLFLNDGTDAAPNFGAVQIVAQRAADLVVPSLRSSFEALDLTGDGRKDLLTGNTAGQLILYANRGSDTAPLFVDSVHVEADGAPLALSGSRSRPAVCAWDSDAYPDVLIGSSEGRVHLFRGVDDPSGIEQVGPIAEAGGFGAVAAAPNPFREAVTLTISPAPPAGTRVIVRDVRGRVVATRTTEDRGRSARLDLLWDGRDTHGRTVASGVYFVSVRSGDRRGPAGRLVRVR